MSHSAAELLKEIHKDILFGYYELLRIYNSTHTEETNLYPVT